MKTPSVFEKKVAPLPPKPAVPPLRRKQSESTHVDVMATMSASAALSPPSSPESSPEENDMGVANSTRRRASDASASGRSAGRERGRAGGGKTDPEDRMNDDDEVEDATFVREPRYDPDAGVFPPRAKRDWTESATLSAMPEWGTGLGFRAEGEPPLPGSAFGWVPPAGSAEASHYVRPTAAELPSQPSGAGGAASSGAAPLELFDDPELETRAPKEWLARKGDEGGVGARSRYFTKHGQFAWKPCLVTSYDEASRTYEIEWRDTPGIKKRVRRLNLVFDAENSDAFRTRLAAATTLREYHEQIKRYRALVERVVFENDVDGVLTEDRLARVYDKVGSRPAPERMPQCTRTFLEDAKDDFRRATKRSILDLSLDDPEKANVIARETGVVPLRRRPKAPRVAVADRFDGRSPTTGEDVGVPSALSAANAIGNLETRLPDADPGFLEALHKFYASYDARDERLTLLAASAVVDVEDGVPVALFPGAPLPPARPMSLQAFERFHRQYMQETASRVRANLTQRACDLCVALEEKVRDVALGVEDPAVRAAHLARLAKMPRFAQRLTLVVQDGLRTAVERGARDAREFWTRGFGGGDAAAEGDAHARHRPMFSVRLVVRDGAAAFEPPLESVRDVSLAIFDDAIDMFKGFQCVREKVMQQRGALDPSAEQKNEPDARAETDEFGIQKRIVPTPARDEPFVVAARAAIAEVLEENFPGPRALAERFAAFEELMEKPETESHTKAPKVDSVESADAAAENRIASRDESAADSGPAGFGPGPDETPGASGPEPSEPSVSTHPPEPEPEPDPAGGSAPPELTEEEEPKEMTLAETEAEMRRLAELVDAVESTSDSFEPFRLIGVDCVEIKRALVGVATERRDALVAKLVEQFHALNAEAYGRFRAITDRLASDVETPEALDDLRRFAADAARETESLRATLATSAAMAEALERSGVNLEDDVVDTYWNAITQPASVPQKLKAYELRAKELQKAMTETLKADIKANNACIAEAKSAVHEFIELGNIDLAEDRLAAVEAMDARLAELKKKGEVYANREELFGRPVTTYPALNSLFREWEPYANLWRVCAEFGRYQPEWTNGPFPQLNPEKVTAMVETWNRAITKMLKHIKGVPAEVCAELKARLARFETNLPIVAALRNPGLRDRHWKDMSEDLGFAVKADAEFSLARAVQLGLHEHIDVLEKYSEAASKEYSLERALDSMHQNWRGVEFETSPWRDTGSFVLKGTDETQMLLDDQIVKTQSMRDRKSVG